MSDAPVALGVGSRNEDYLSALLTEAGPRPQGYRSRRFCSRSMKR
jgi:hypothetical protein